MKPSRTHVLLSLAALLTLIVTLLPLAAQSAREVTQADVERWMKDLSNWGRWGTQDQLGALNLITPEKRKSAAQLVDSGVSLSLSHDVVKETAASSPAFEHRMVSTGFDSNADSSADVYTVQYHGY